MDHGFQVAGIAIPSDDPLFLALLAVHVPAGIVATSCAVAAIASRKRPGRHPTAGSVYYWAFAVVLATALGLTATRPTEAWPVAALGSAGFGAATVGRLARRRQRIGWLRTHIVGMGSSFILMLTAFYVDNGPRLPLWRALPAWAFWVLPAAVGVPLVLVALRRHR